MPVPRRIDQCDRLVAKSLGTNLGYFWRIHPKRVEGDRLIFELKFARSAVTLRKYKTRYEHEIERVCKAKLVIDWEF